MPGLTTSEQKDRRWRYHLRRAAGRAAFPRLKDHLGREHQVSAGTALSVLNVLVDFCEDDGTMPYSTAMTTLCSRSRRSAATVVRAINYLVQLGYVERTVRGGGGVKKTLYRVFPAAICEAAVADESERRREARASKRGPNSRPPKWAGKPPTVGGPPSQRERAGSVKRAPLTSQQGSSRLAPGTSAESPQYDCGHGLDLRCAPTTSGQSSCLSCRKGWPPEPGKVRGPGDAPAPRLQPRRTSRRDRKHTPRPASASDRRTAPPSPISATVGRGVLTAAGLAAGAAI